MKLSDIKLGTRHRKELGDIAGLAASIKDVGLLHPLVVDPSGNLIAGERRYRALLMLDMKDAPVTVATALEDVTKALKAERDENRCRKDFAPSEAAALAEKLEQIERPKAAERQAAPLKRGTEQPARSEKITERGKGETRQIVADAVGMSPPTLTKARAVADAAKSHPETYGEIADEMDRTGKVAPAYEKLAERSAEPEAPSVRLPIQPKAQPQRHKPSGGEVWAKWVAECTRVLNDTRDAGGIEQLIKSWAPGEDAEYLDMLRGFRDAADGWIKYLEKRCLTSRKAG